MVDLERARLRIVEKYKERTQRSHEVFERAANSLEGGTTRTSVFFRPYPSYIAEGKGCRLIDIDGNPIIDFLNNWSSLIHGHAYPPILDAVARQMMKGSAYAAPSELEIELAELIQKRVPSIERLRFSSSGSEAVMFALRLARAYSGRRKIAKFEGGFHGSHELASVSVGPSVEKAGPADSPISVAECAGIPSDWVADVITLPFNNLNAVERILDQHKEDLAAVIVEPIIGSGGIILPQPGFLAGLRALTSKYGSILIFDEIISLRVSLNGAQGLYGVTPDLTTLGKIISGGFPLAAFGGRAEIMQLLDPRSGVPPIPQSGTFNAAAVCCAAGLAGYGGINAEIQKHIDGLGERIRGGINNLFRRLKIKAQAVGVGSLFNIHFSEEPITDYRAVIRGNREVLPILSLAMLNRGVCLAPRGMGCVSSVMTDAEVAAFLTALEGAVVEDLQLGS
jgi:glutamate-1-semialdehyde 2,1-aminomutase